MAGRDPRNHYEVLEIARNASDEVIKGAYKYLAQKWHPDKQAENRAEADRMMKIINEAYAVLSDPRRRKEHDEWIAAQDEEATSAAGGAEAASQTTGQSTGLSPAAREHYAKAIASMFWPWALITGAGVAFIGLVLLLLVDWIKAYAEKHSAFAMFLAVACAVQVARSIIKSRHERCLIQDDDVLKVMYAESSRKKTTAWVVSAIVLVGILLVGVIADQRLLDKPVAPATGVAAAPSISGPPQAAPPSITLPPPSDPVQPPLMGAKQVYVDNGCPHQVQFFVAHQSQDADWKVRRWTVNGASRTRLTLSGGGGPFLAASDDYYYFARVADRDYLWDGRPNDGVSRPFAVSGEEHLFRPGATQHDKGDRIEIGLQCENLGK